MITYVLAGPGALIGFIYFVGPLFSGLPIYTEIDSSPQVVYALLADLESYPEWHPYHVEVIGKTAVHAPLVASSQTQLVVRDIVSKSNIAHVNLGQTLACHIGNPANPL